MLGLIKANQGDIFMKNLIQKKTGTKYITQSVMSHKIQFYLMTL